MVTKNETFSKEFFNKIWFKDEEHKYIYILETKFGNKIILFKNGGQKVLWHCLIMLISVKMALLISILLPKDA